MALKFKKINKLQLRGDAHFQFHTEFKDLLGKITLAPGRRGKQKRMFRKCRGRVSLPCLVLT
jgi:hypothetical protein